MSSEGDDRIEYIVLASSTSHDSVIILDEFALKKLTRSTTLKSKPGFFWLQARVFLCRGLSA